jgi:outer membrane protein
VKKVSPLFLAIVTGWLVSTAAVAADPARIGYVDLRKVLLESKAGKANKAEMEKLIKQKQDQLRGEEQKLKTLQQNFEKEQLLLTDQQKKDRQKEFQEKVQAFQKLQAGAEQEVRRKDGEFTQKAVDAIRAIVADLAREKKLMLVFEITAQPVYAEPGPDLTADVLRKYDAKGGK